MNQSQLAKELGVTKQYIYKLVKQGKLESARDGKDFDLEKVLLILGKAPQIVKQDVTLEEIEGIFQSLEAKATAMLQDPNSIYDRALLEGIEKQIDIFKKLATAKIETAKELELASKLFSKDEVLDALNKFLSPHNEYLNNLPSNFATRFPDTPREAIDFLEADVNRQKEALHVGTLWK